MRALLLRVTLLLLLVLSLSPWALASGLREIHVSVRPRSVPENLDRWAYYPGTGLTLFGDPKEFEKATNDLIVFVYDKEANAENTQNNCVLKALVERRGDAVRLDPHQPEGGLARCGGSGGKASEGAKGWDAAAAQALARAGAAASLSSPAGEKGGSPRGVAGGMNPDAEPSAGAQAAVATVQIALSASEMKQIVQRATRFIVARLAKQAEIEAVEKATEEAIKQLAKEGKAVSSEAIEARAREAAEEAERALAAGGGAGKSPGSASTVFHVPGPRRPPPIGQSGTPIRSGSGTATQTTTLAPGPYAKESIPAHTGRPTATEQRQVNDLMQKYGCHTCGTKVPGTRSGNAIADHQPPQALAEPKEFYPHCNDCKARQGGEVLQALRKAQGK